MKLCVETHEQSRMLLVGWTTRRVDMSPVNYFSWVRISSFQKVLPWPLLWFIGWLAAGWSAAVMTPSDLPWQYCRPDSQEYPNIEVLNMSTVSRICQCTEAYKLSRVSRVTYECRQEGMSLENTYFEESNNFFDTPTYTHTHTHTHAYTHIYTHTHTHTHTKVHHTHTRLYMISFMWHVASESDFSNTLWLDITDGHTKVFVVQIWWSNQQQSFTKILLATCGEAIDPVHLGQPSVERARGS